MLLVSEAKRNVFHGRSEKYWVMPLGMCKSYRAIGCASILVRVSLVIHDLVDG